MKINITNKDFLLLEQEIQGLSGTVFQFWMRSKIQDFYNENNSRLLTIKQKRERINSEWLQKDKDDRYVIDEATKKPKVIEGKSEEDYQKAINALLDEQNVLSI
jgi:capsule polysaccharide export protein KpsC/LpsZ